MATFVRFETPYHCGRSRQPLGIFWAAATIRDRSDLHPWTRQWLCDSWNWLRENLPAPCEVAIDPRAIFWFHPQTKIIREIWHLVAILREEGVSVGLRRTNLPGRILYGDDFQIAAIPFGHGRHCRKRRLPTLV
jgi:hypothetical protein